MSPAEARWFGETLLRFDTPDLTPLLNLGSSSEEYRSQACPEINSLIFGPLRARHVQVYHVDAKEQPGVDIAGDILCEEVHQTMRALAPRAIMCNNILEHVIDRERFAATCEDLLPPGGILFVSVPHKYPFHPDPIDTMYRPSLDELVSLFPRCRLVTGTILPFGNYLEQILAKRWLLLRDSYLLVAGAFKKERWRVLLGNYRFLVRQYLITCAVFRKIEV